MINLEKKTIKTSIQGIGSIEISLIKTGNERWLKQIELFVTESADSFTVIAMKNPELANPLFLQRAIQAFVTHIQSGGEEQQSNQIRNHFRNWINKQNGSLKSIIYGEQSTASESHEYFRDSVKEAFAQRYSNR